MKTFETEKNAQLIYRLMGLGMAGAILHIGAHPDDEDIGLLAYFSCKFGVRSAYWSATRGEGGQNRIGPYRDEALGVYRTWESLAAREADRSECLFGPFYDFGYSKNGEEAMAKWGREALVREIVRAIRFIRPHIIISRWTGTPADLHGQHQAVGKAALEAFDLAGDPDRFTELRAQGLGAWKPLKFYHSLDNSGGDLTAGGAGNLSGRINPAFEKEGLLRINTGEFDPISGRTYQERAWLAYNRHQTQAMGLAPEPGDFFYYLSLHKSWVQVPQKETSLFDGLDPSLTGLADYLEGDFPSSRNQLDAVKTKIDEALQKFRADDPMQASTSLLDSLNLLRNICSTLQNLQTKNETTQAIYLYLIKRVADFEDIIARCLGLELECLSDRSRIIPGMRFRVSAHLWNHRRIEIKKAEFKPRLPEGWESHPFKQEKEEEGSTFQSGPFHSFFYKKEFEIIPPNTADLTCPYWLSTPRKAYVYHWPEGESCSLPFDPPPLQIQCEIKLEHSRITLKKPVLCREGFPGGFRELPLAIIPPLSLHPVSEKEFLQLTNGKQQIDLQVVARNNTEQKVEGSLELVAPPGWQIHPGQIDLTLTEKGETKKVHYTVTTSSEVQAGHHYLQYRIWCGERDYGVIVNPVRMGCPGLPTLPDGSNCIKEEFIVTPARVAIHLIDVKFVEGLQYAYVRGANEELLDALKPFGIHFHLITDSEMVHLDLSRFDAVVIGPDAYLLREELRKNASRFLEYVKEGGTLIVQYQGYRYQTPGFTPYPFSYRQPHDRVTHENAPVKLLDLNHALFRLPNAIGPEDFSGWVRDRGFYFWGQWDGRFRPLLACSDSGEEPLEGGLIECQYGRGNFLYTGYSFFRQLPAGVPGPFRLFANILAMPAARILERIEFLKKISLFSLLSEQQLDTVARIMSERWVEDGHYICRQGEMGDELYIVYSGKVEVVRESNVQEQIIFLAKDGDCLGEMAVLGDIPRTASLRAQGNVQLLVIEGSHFISLLRQHPDMSIQVIKLLVKRIAPS